MVVGLPTGPREGPFEPIPVPPEMNWDFYVGQAPKKEYVGVRKVTKSGDKENVSYECRCAHGVFRWWYCFSGGQMTDWGAHHNDIAQWANGTELSGPVEVHGKSFVDMIPGGYDTAAEYEVKFKYENGVIMTVTDGKRAPNGVKFIGPNGWIFVTRGQIEASKPELLQEPLPDSAVRLYRSDDHMGNFFECVRTRKAPIAEVEIGHRSITTAHLGIISIRMGGLKLGWNPQRERFTGEHAKEANNWVARGCASLTTIRSSLKQLGEGLRGWLKAAPQDHAKSRRCNSFGKRTLQIELAVNKLHRDLDPIQSVLARESMAR
jgi:hypothetical protein